MEYIVKKQCIARYLGILLGLLIFCQGLVLVPETAYADSAQVVYDAVQAKYPGEVQKLLDNGASQLDIRSFILALESELQKSGNFIESNANKKLADAMLVLLFTEKQDRVFNAVFKGWNLSLSALLDALDTGGTSKLLSMLPQSLQEIGRLVKANLLANPLPPVDGGSGGGVIPTPIVTTPPISVVVTPPVVSTVYTTYFKDIEKHWARADIEFLAMRGILKGVNGKSFQPNQPVTRVEFLTMLVRLLGMPLEAKSSVKFSDVSIDSWYTGTVNAAVYAGLVQGNGVGRFEPDRKITRQEMAVMLTNAFTLKKQGRVSAPPQNTGVALALVKFKDGKLASAWAQQALVMAVKEGMISGRPGMVLAPKAQATRAESAVVIRKLMKGLQLD